MMNNRVFKVVDEHLCLGSVGITGIDIVKLSSCTGSILLWAFFNSLIQK